MTEKNKVCECEDQNLREGVCCKDGKDGAVLLAAATAKVVLSM